MICYNYLLNIKYKNITFIIIILIILIISLILSCLLSTYDKYVTFGVWKDNSIMIDVPLNNSDAVRNGKFIKIDKQNYSYSIKSISELQEYNFINYQTYIVNVSQNFKDNQVLNITFYYNKQKIIQKIVKIIF